MDDHRCALPEGRQPLELVRFECPVCKTAWEREPKEPMNPAPVYDFATNEHVTPARWVRLEGVSP